ncbi:hypothetical protein FRC02_001747 [Tulasnella sp. 418]|nr:hypothetical protein FRC02_001747 [Tulasnella sp. 418]
MTQLINRLAIKFVHDCVVDCLSHLNNANHHFHLSNVSQDPKQWPVTRSSKLARPSSLTSTPRRSTNTPLSIYVQHCTIAHSITKSTLTFDDSWTNSLARRIHPISFPRVSSVSRIFRSYLHVIRFLLLLN